MSEPRKIISNNIGVTPPNSNPSSKDNDIPIYMSLQGLLYQAMADVVNCLEKERMAFFDAYAKGACVFGGLTQNADGTITIDKDSSGNATGGMLGVQMQFGIDSAKDQAQAAQKDALGSFISAGFSAASCLGSAGAIYGSRPSTEQIDQQTLYSNVGTDLNSTAEGDLVSKSSIKLSAAKENLKAFELNVGDPFQLTDSERTTIQAKNNEIAKLEEEVKISKKIDSISDQRSKYAEFAQDLKSADNEKASEAKKVLELMKRDETAMNKVKSHNEALQNSIEKDIEKNSNRLSNISRTLEMLSQAGSQGGQGYGKTTSADLTQKSAAEKIVADVQAQLNQTYQANQTSLKQQTDSLQNEASQIAGSYAQWGRA